MVVGVEVEVSGADGTERNALETLILQTNFRLQNIK
jgi:hypothetical protein